MRYSMFSTVLSQPDGYHGNAGQVKWVRGMKDTGKITSTHLGQIYSVLEDAWVKALGWGYMNMPLEEAERTDDHPQSDDGESSLDHAMAGENGGIDLTADKTPLEVRNSGEGIKFNIDPAMLEQLQNAPGFVPVIINIRPMTDLRQFLGA